MAQPVLETLVEVAVNPFPDIEEANGHRMLLKGDVFRPRFQEQRMRSSKNRQART